MLVTDTDLAKFIGHKARLWDFSPTHDRLVIKLTADDGSEMFLVLSGCDELVVPVFWRVARPRITGASPPFVEFVDDGVRIRCQDASLHPKYVRSN